MRRPAAVLIGHFPPPVHGMAVGTQSFANHLERHLPVVRLDISGGSHSATPTYHLRRTARVVVAICQLVRLRGRSSCLYVGCDAGLGMLFTTVVLAVARALRYQTFLHHHSYAYVNRRSRLMGLVTAVAGPGCCHLVYCEAMRRAFAANYRGAIHVELLSVAYVLAAGQGSAPSLPSGPLTIGHLSNLTEAKGLGTVIQSVERALADGVDVRLVLAGPTMAPGDSAVLEEGLRRLGDAAEYRGPVFGDERERFYDEIDVFLFPSRYVHESLGLVAFEAMGRGVPIVAFRCGCLNTDSIGAGGVVMEPAQDFVEEAAAVLGRWANDRTALLAASRAATSQADNMRAEALAQLDAVVQRVACGRA